MPDTATSLEPLETTYPLVEDTDETLLVFSSHDGSVVHRHAGWRVQRLRTRHALQRAGVSPRKVLDFDLCGSNAWLARSADDPSITRVLVSTCKSRWCVPCARARSYVLATNLRRKLAQTTCRKIELTLRSSSDPLSDQLTRLWNCFRLLRKTPDWKHIVAGGAAFLEATISPSTGLWHPHLHIVYVGRYYPHSALSAAWQRITGDSPIVYIKLVGNAHAVARYVTKYVTKPTPSVSALSLSQHAELIQAFHGRRLANTFGNWRLFRLTENLDSTVWEPIAPISQVLEALLERDSRYAQPLSTLDERSRDILAAELRARSPTLSLDLLS